MTLPLPRSFRLRFVQLGFPFGCEVGGRLFAYVATTLPTVHKDGYRIFVVESTPTEFDGKKLRLPFSRFQALLVLLFHPRPQFGRIGAIKREEPHHVSLCDSSQKKRQGFKSPLSVSCIGSLIRLQRYIVYYDFANGKSIEICVNFASTKINIV